MYMYVTLLLSFYVNNFFFAYRPSVLDNFALLSGQLNSLGRVLKSDKVPSLKNQLLLPLLLLPDPDENLRVSYCCSVLQMLIHFL